VAHSLIQQKPEEQGVIDGGTNTGSVLDTEQAGLMGSVRPLGTGDAADAETWAGDVWYPNCFPQDSERWKMKIGVLVDRAAQDWAKKLERANHSHRTSFFDCV